MADGNWATVGCSAAPSSATAAGGGAVLELELAAVDVVWLEAWEDEFLAEEPQPASATAQRAITAIGMRGCRFVIVPGPTRKAMGWFPS